jgi:hypothetical protein
MPNDEAPEHPEAEAGESSSAPPARPVNFNPFAVYYFHKGEWYIVAWGF